MKMVLMLLLVMLCYGHAYFINECINEYEDHRMRRLCIDARYWEIMANKFNDKLVEAYKDC